MVSKQTKIANENDDKLSKRQFTVKKVSAPKSIEQAPAIKLN